ncbi:MAG: Gfo/Idh/MocA family oxidoreductase [Opitutales bacterium]
MVVKLGIIGTGLMAHAHAKKFSEMKNVSLTACADIVVERAEGFAREFGIPEVYVG